MRIVQEEIFGPVLVVQTFDDEAEAIRLANDTIYGLAGAVFTQDIAKAHRVIRKMRAGITWINTYHPTYNEAPWGGYKQSGIGRELGTYGYDAYTEVKQINVNLDVAAVGLVQRVSALDNTGGRGWARPEGERDRVAGNRNDHAAGDDDRVGQPRRRAGKEPAADPSRADAYRNRE